MTQLTNSTLLRLPPDMPGCHCEKFEDAGFKIESLQYSNLHQCRNCGGFRQLFPPSINPSGLLPLKHAVLVLPYEVEAVTKSGIILAPQTTERDQLAEQRGVILALGSEADVGVAKVGDKILFSKWSGQIAVGTLDGKKYRIVNDRDIFLKIEGEKVEGGEDG